MRKLLMILYCLALCMQGLAIGEGIATDLSEVEYGEIASALTEETVPDLGETVLWTDEMAMDERGAAPEVMAAESSESAYVPKTVPVEISPATFPDADFRDYVYDNYDLDGDGMLSEYEINEATSLSIGYVSSLEGIRYLNRLQYIDIYQIDFEGATLDLSGMTSLTCADFYKCYGGTLNFSGCSSLTQLSVYYCGCDLNISDCVALYWLNCGLNGCTIDISDCPFLIKAVRDGKRTDAVEGEDRVDYRPVTYQYGEYTLYVDEPTSCDCHEQAHADRRFSEQEGHREAEAGQDAASHGKDQARNRRFDIEMEVVGQIGGGGFLRRHSDSEETWQDHDHGQDVERQKDEGQDRGSQDQAQEGGDNERREGDDVRRG